MLTRRDPSTVFGERASRLGVLSADVTGPSPAPLHPRAGLAADAVRLLAADHARGERGGLPDHRVHEFAGRRALAFLPGPNWLDLHAGALAARLKVDAAELRAQLAPLAAFTPHAAVIASRALADLAEDLGRRDEALAEQDSVIASFTDELSRSYETLSLLYSIGNGLSDLSTPARFVRVAAERLQAGADFSSIAVRFGSLEASKPDEIIVSCRDASREEALRAAAALLPADPERFAGPKRVVAPWYAHCASPGAQALVHPLVLDGTFLGYLVGADKGGHDPMLSSYDLQLFQATAAFLAAFLKTCRLFDEQAKMFVGTIKALTASIDAKDKYTRGHSERVAWLAAALAGAMGLPEADVRRIHIAGIVHDVGKIGVPEAVLCKPGRLTDEEFGWIKKHPEIGHRILADIPQLADILPGVLHHHERIDGKGYPHGLAGEAIPLMARIIAVADTFDALSSTRSYRSARPRDVVLAEISRSSGTQLDPAVAAALLRVDLAEFDRMLVEHATTAPAAVVGAAA